MRYIISILSLVWKSLSQNRLKLSLINKTYKYKIVKYNKVLLLQTIVLFCIYQYFIDFLKKLLFSKLFLNLLINIVYCK